MKNEIVLKLGQPKNLIYLWAVFKEQIASNTKRPLFYLDYEEHRQIFGIIIFYRRL